jgi:hypothetical protein
MVTRAVRSETVATVVDTTKGEFLTYQVSFKGGSALFVLVDSANSYMILSSNSPSPSRQWPLAADPVSVFSAHVATFHFANATQYTYRVDLNRGAGNVVTLIDIDYSSNDSSDIYTQPLDVTVLR